MQLLLSLIIAACFYRFLTLRALKEFKTAITVTPTSAKTAAHNEARPKVLNIKTNIFTPIAKAVLFFAILKVFLDIFHAVIILDGSSVIITISASSIAASDPSPPIAIPISALVRTGASLIPSPT